MDKKIFALLAIFLIAIVGCAYAADSDSSNNNTVTISGVNFTIPEGLTENVTETLVNESGSDDGYNYVTDQKTFEDDENLLVISVSTYEQNITDDLVKDVGDKTTINNITGYSQDLGFLALFAYVQDGKVVVLTANDMNLIEEALS